MTLVLKKPNITPDLAFYKVTNENKYKTRDLTAMYPFVCVKIPTGGGKTLVGCKAVERDNGQCYIQAQDGYQGL